MSFDQFASSNGDPAAPRPKPAQAAPAETDEDLFNFDELLGATKPKPALSAELDEALAAVEGAKVEIAKDIPAAASAPASTAATSAPAASAATAPQTAAASASKPGAAPVARTDAKTPAPTAPTVAGTVVHQRLSMSPIAAVMLGAIVLANVTLMLFAWNSVQSVKQLVLDVTHDVADTTSELRAESTRRNERVALDSEPVFGALPEGYRTLEVARERIQRGEHARARRMLYGLLAVIDRIEPPARGEVEAQAGFLIADSFAIEADALAPEARR